MSIVLPNNKFSKKYQNNYIVLCSSVKNNF